MLRRNEKGFTLIELMIVVAIIGILAAIAVPNFMTYRKRSYDKQAQAVLKNVGKAQAAYNTQYQMYSNDAGGVILNGIDPNVPLTNSTIDWAVTAADASTFTATASHALGLGITYSIDQTDKVTP